MSMKLKFVQHFRDKDTCKHRYYFRRNGQPLVPLGVDPNTPEFLEKYLHCLNEASHEGNRNHQIGERTLSTALSEFQRTSEYHSLSARTKTLYNMELTELDRRIGHIPIQKLERSHIFEVTKRGGYTVVRSRSLLKMIKRVLNAEVEAANIDVSPAVGLKPPTHVSKPHYTWSENDIELFRAVWSQGSRERLQLELFLNTAQRCSDICRLTWSSVISGKIAVQQKKTERYGNSTLLIPILPELQRELDQLPLDAIALVTNRYGQALGASALSAAFSKAVKRAGLPSRAAAHGLRRACSRRLAESGCSPHEIQAITGHRSLSEVGRYTADANQEALADAAFSRIKAGQHSSVSKHEEDCQKPKFII